MRNGSGSRIGSQCAKSGGTHTTKGPNWIAGKSSSNNDNGKSEKSSSKK